MNGKRLDLQQRPELLKGQIEFEAGSEYCVRPPAHPTFLFLIGTPSHTIIISRYKLSECSYRYASVCMFSYSWIPHGSY